MNNPKALSVGICGWELSHNAAGRAVTLLDVYDKSPLYSARLIGCIFPAWGRALWSPLRHLKLEPKVLRVEDQSRFLKQAEQLVRQNPLDLVHLSKPKLPNILIGLLYKLIWQAKVIVDIDDEELAFVGADKPVTHPSDLETEMANLTGKEATQLAVGLSRYFDGITVSNPALQAVYGGQMVPHVRDETEFSPSLARRRLNRSLLGIPLEDKVVLFSGTPRKHKGLFETAESLAELGRGDVRFVIVGDFPFTDIKDELLKIKGVNFQFVTGQSYRHIADVVSVGDVAVLLQDASSRVTRFQAPAKLTDALAMGLTVLAQDLPALSDLLAAGAFEPVTKANLTPMLANALKSQVDPMKSHTRQVFLDKLSIRSVLPKLQAYLEACPNNDIVKTGLNDQIGPYLETIMEGPEPSAPRLSETFLELVSVSLAQLTSP